MKLYKKEDSERAEAVMETIWRAIDRDWSGLFETIGERTQFRNFLYDQVPFLMNVFRAVRGEE